jgi:hypothetical protein
MSVYLVNLGFSIQPAGTNSGTFQPDSGSGSALLRSAVWLMYAGPAMSLQDTFVQIQGALNPAQWNFLQEASSLLGLNANADWIFIRVFPTDSNSAGHTLLLNAVFGQGSSSELTAPSTSLQSPLVVNGLPRTIVDSIQLSAQYPTPSSWAAPSSDGAWTFSLGEIHGADNDYSFNVGASVCTSPSAGTPIFQYGHDPHVRVGMGRKKLKAA